MEVALVEERELVRRCIARDHAAFGELVRTHETQMRVACARFAHVTEADVDDIMQQAWIKIHTHLPNFDGHSSLATWIYRIVTNLCIDRTRKSRTNKEDGYDDLDQNYGSGSTQISHLVTGEFTDRMDAALVQLSDKHRDVLVRRARGDAYKEIAAALGISEGTVMSRLHHARQNLKRHLDAYDQPQGDVMDESSEREIVQRVLSGDQEAFGEIYRQYHERIKAFLLGKTRSEVDADELTHDVFMKAFKALGSFKFGGYGLSPWLYKIATNMFTNFYRRRRRLREILETEIIPTQKLMAESEVEHRIEALSLPDWCLRILASIPENYRVCVIMVDIQGLAYKEVAEQLGLPIGTVMSRIFRGRRVAQATIKTLHLEDEVTALGLTSLLKDELVIEDQVKKPNSKKRRSENKSDTFMDLKAWDAIVAVPLLRSTWFGPRTVLSLTDLGDREGRSEDDIAKLLAEATRRGLCKAFEVDTKRTICRLIEGVEMARIGIGKVHNGTPPLVLR